MAYKKIRQVKLDDKIKARNHCDLESRIEMRSLQKACNSELNLILANLDSAYYAVTQGPDIKDWKIDLYGDWYKNLAWFRSSSDEVFSFNWCIDALENNGERIPRERIVEKIGEWEKHYEKKRRKVTPKIVPILDLTANI